jgi:excinuclease ABC subunit C
MSETEPPVQVPLLRESELAPSERTLAEILDRLPTDPGVYIMKDRRKKAIYIGKAGNLRARVRQYFQPNTGDVRLFVPLLEGIVADIETVVTSNEKEALLLENTLIKRHQPRFNVNLRDDKNYLVLRLDPEGEWPRLEVGRKIADDGAYYFGPYHSATSCRETLRVVNRHFQLRTCTDHVLHNRRRPCLQYQIKRCPAPCVLPVAREDYADQVRDVRLFLEGKDDELVARLQTRMKDAAKRTEFETAAAIRDQVKALEVTLQAQRVVSTDFVDQDIFGLHREGLALEIVVMAIRQGKMVGSRAYSFGGQEFPESELLSSFIGLFYDSPAASIPDELLLPFAIDDAELKAEWLSERRPGRRRVELLVPQRGDRKRLSDMAQKNAQVSFTTRRNAREDIEVMLAKLQKKLRLPKLPRVIECYDISHIQGFAPVASMVVFVDGRPERSRYRTYRVRGAENAGAVPRRPGGRAGNDDFASMYEVLSRRFRRAREGDAGWELPDLIVIDGGKGQLGMALAAARDVGIDVRPGQGLPLVGLAKEREVDEAESPPPGPGPRGSEVRAPEPSDVPEPASEARNAPAQLDTDTHTHSPSQTHTESSTDNGDHLSTAEAPVRTTAPRLVSLGRGEDAEADGAAGSSAAGVAIATTGSELTGNPMRGTDEAEEGERREDSESPAAATASEPARRGRRRAPTTNDRSAANARRPDRIYLPHAKDAIPIRPSSAEMFVLQHLRDEAHRFAVAFHRRRRGNLTLRSALGDVPGIGPQRQRLLLRHFGSLKKIREASVDDLSAVPGMTAKAAAAVFAHFGTAPAMGVPAPSSRRTRSQDTDVASGGIEVAAPTSEAASPAFAVADVDDADEDALESAFADVDDELDVDADTSEPPEKT